MKKIMLFTALFMALILAGCEDPVEPPTTPEEEEPKNEKPELSSASKITEFNLSIEGSQVSIVDNKIDITVPYGSDVSALKPSIKFSESASIKPAADSIQDFRQPIIYTVTAEDGSSQYFIVNVIERPSPDNSLIDFSINGYGTHINHAEKTVVIYVPYRDTVRNFVPRIKIHEDASVYPEDRELQDFSTPVEYTVTSASGVDNVYLVSVEILPNVENLILVANLDSAVTSSIHQDEQEIHFVVPRDVDVSNLAPVVTLSELASVNPASGSVQDFSSPVNYTVTAESGEQRVYSVIVSLVPRTENQLLEFVLEGETAVINGSDVYVDRCADNDSYSPDIDVVLSPGASSFKYWSSENEDTKKFTVTAENGDENIYTVHLNRYLVFKDSIVEFRIREKINKPDGRVYVSDLKTKLNGELVIMGVSNGSYYTRPQRFDDLKWCPELTYLAVDISEIQDVSFPKLVNLRKLRIVNNTENADKNLDVSCNPLLESLDVTTVDNIILHPQYKSCMKELRFYGCHINEAIDFSGMKKLEKLYLDPHWYWNHEDITALDLSESTELTSLTVYGYTYLKDLDISTCNKLQNLILGRYDLSYLKLPAAEFLEISIGGGVDSSFLPIIDFSDVVSIARLTLMKGNQRILDLSNTYVGYIKLDYFPKLDILDLSGTTASNNFNNRLTIVIRPNCNEGISIWVDNDHFANNQVHSIPSQLNATFNILN